MDFEGLVNNHLRSLVRTEAVNSDLISMPFHLDPAFCGNIQTLPKELRQLFSKLFNEKKEKLKLKDLLPFQPKKSISPTCYKLLSTRIQSYRCFDCQIHNESLLCEECFKKGNHMGHRYRVVKDEGNCDCGCREIIKQSGFCSEHRGEQQIALINSNEEFIFTLHIRQLFIWILVLYRNDQVKEGEILLLHFIDYLAYLNQDSTHYNTLTTRLLFAQANPISDHIYYLSLNSLPKLKIVNAVVDLYYSMLGLRQFKERLLASLLKNYNRVDNIETSKFMKLIYPLLLQSDVVISVMKRHPIAIRPQRKFSIQAYYSFIGMIKDMHPEAARAFITPLLMIDAIKFPFLDEIEQKCEKNNSLLVEVFPMFIREQTEYYLHLIAIIKAIEDKEVLQAMMRNYCKMVISYSFKKNKIILVPQRILMLVIYKYYRFDLTKVNKEQLATILQLSEDDLQDILFNLCTKFAECLFEFSMNLNRTTYFENYLPLYAKAIQVISIDYLAIKMLSLLLGKKRFHSILDHIYRTDRVESTPQERTDFYKAGNIFLKIVLEIVTSPRTERLISAKLGHKNEQSYELYKQLFQKMGEITEEELKIVSLAFDNQEMISRSIIDQTLTFDPSKKKYNARASEEKSGEIPLQFMVSLLQTKLSKFVQKKPEAQQKFLQLTEQEQKLKDTMLSCNHLQRIIKSQLLLINNNEDYKLLVRDLINLAKTIKLAYKEQEQEFNQIFFIILEIVHLKYDNSQSENRIFLQQLQAIISTQRDTEHKKESSSKESQRRKELLKLKKEKMMKSKKIKENQQLFLSKQNEPQEKEKEMCLICRQSNNNEQMCYVAKMRYTSLLFDFMKMKGDNLIFKSCYHTVHFECFNRMEKNKEETSCPLCKCAINIVLPMQNSYNFELYEKIYKRIELVLLYFIMQVESQDKKDVICEAICYFAYSLLINLEDLAQITPKQERLMRIVFGVVEHSMNYENNIERRAEKADDNLTFFIDEIKKRKSGEAEVCIKVILLIYSRLKWGEYFDEEEQTAIDLALSLAKYLPVQNIVKIIKVLSSLGQLPDNRLLDTISSALTKQEQTVPDNKVTFLKLWIPPRTLGELFDLRDSLAPQCKTGHQICICLTCSKQYCLTCKKVMNHSNQYHKRQSLFFNTYTGGLYYIYRGLQLSLTCFYINQFSKIWKPEYPISSFSLDLRLYLEVLGELKNGNLFSHLISTFEGLKGGQVSDRV